MFGKKTNQELMIKYIPLSEKDHITIIADNYKGGAYETDLYKLLELLESLKAIDMYETPLAYWLGKAFLTGRGRVPVNIERGIYYLNEASERGIVEAQEMMAMIRKDRKAIEKIIKDINNGKYPWYYNI